MRHPTRRQAVALALAGPLLLRMAPAQATPESMRAAIDAFTDGAVPTEGRIELKIPLLVENGNSVPLSVSVDSPMTDADHCEAVAIFNEINALPDTIRFHFTPASGRAAAQTRIRLNGSQAVHAVARMSDGSLWSAATDVIVTAPACQES